MDDLLEIHAPFMRFFALREGDRLFLIDSGFVGGWGLLQRALRRRGWQNLPIEGLLLTHGHLDHTLNAAVIKERTACWIAAPRLDAEHCAQRYHYRGIASVCGALEGLGRAVLRFRPFEVDHWLDDGDELPIWGGLRAVHLPGHTVGHMGYLAVERRVLFAGDLFFSFGFRNGWPLPIYNSCPEYFPASARRVRELDLDGLFPNHGDRASPEEHLRRVRRFTRRY
ncbi:MAG: MBL fold metallo-hydrolase [Opitutales bacterium]